MAISQYGKLIYDAALAQENTICKIDASHVILAYSGTDDDGYIKTFYIAPNGTATELDSLEHDTGYAQHNFMIALDATHFVLAYSGVNDDGFVKTFSVDASYQITELDSLEHDTSECSVPSAIKIDSTHFIIAYSSVDYAGIIKTFSVDGSYQITELDSLEHDSVEAFSSAIAAIDATHYVLAYSGTDSTGVIKTFSIDGSYEITEIDDLVHETTEALEFALCKIDTTHFLLAYSATDGTGSIKTFTIDGSYAITQTHRIDHDAGDGYFMSLVAENSNNYLLAYTNADGDGIIKSIRVDRLYHASIVDTLEHDTGDGYDNSLCQLESGIYALAYEDTDQYGVIKAIRFSASSGLTVKILEKQAGTLTKTAHAWLGGLITSETTGYTTTNGTAAHSTTTHVWTLTGTAGDSVSLKYDTAVACAEGDVIFTTARVRVLTDGVDNIYARVDGTTGGSLSVASQASPVNGTYYDLYGTATITASETGNVRLRWWFYDTSGATGTVMQVERWHAINLTAQFGAGDEPDAADLQAFYEWRWELMTYKNFGLYNTWGDSFHVAWKIASHGLEYNDVVGTIDDSLPYYSCVYPLNTDWIIVQWVVVDSVRSGFTDATDISYWTKTDYTSRLRAKTLQLNVREDIDSSASMSFNGNAAWQPQLGMTAIIMDGTETLFTGHISKLTVTKQNTTNWTCDCEMSCILTTVMGMIANVSTSTVNYWGANSTQKLLAVLMGSLSGTFSYAAGNQGVWIGNIHEFTETYKTQDAESKKLDEVVNSVCSNVGALILMTPDRRIKFEAQTRTPEDAPRNITDAVSPTVWDMRYDEDISTFANYIMVRGGYDSSGLPVLGAIQYVTTFAISDDVYAALPRKSASIADSSISDSTTASVAAAAYLKRYGKSLPGVFAFSTTDTDYRPGQKISIDIDCLGMTSAKTMLIDSVTIYDVDGKNLFCNVSCSNRDATNFYAAPNKGPTAYMSELSNKVTQSVSALTQSAGSFTPTLYGATTAGTWSYTTQEGYYIRIGNFCYISLRLDASSIASAAGNLMLGGLPFAASAVSNKYFLMVFAESLSWSASMTQLQVSIDGGDDHGVFVGSGNNAAFGLIQTSDISTGDEIRICGVYMV